MARPSLQNDLFNTIASRFMSSRSMNQAAERKIPETLTPPVSIEDAKAQLQSPLFSRIPPEIRNEIFRLALLEYVDPTKLYERDTYWTRPGLEGEKRVDTALLRTCKRVYSETKAIPLQDRSVIMYLGHKSRAPSNAYAYIPGVYALPWTRRLTEAQWSSIKHLQFFVQMYALQTGILHICRRHPWPEITPTVITFTFRYTDWWHWERNQPIFPILNHYFFDMQAVTLPNTVDKVVVEFEMIETKVKQLDGVVGEMFGRRNVWWWKREDGRRLVVKGERDEAGAVREWKWIGPTDFLPRRAGLPPIFPHHGTGETMSYVVKAVTWELERVG